MPKFTVATLAFSLLPVYFTGNLMTEGGDNKIQRALTGTVVSVVSNGFEKRLVNYKSLAKGLLGEAKSRNINLPIFNNFLAEDSNKKSFPALIVDQGKVTKINSSYEIPEEILADAGVKVYPEDIIESQLIFDFLKDKTIGQKIIIKRAPVVNVEINGTKLEVRSWAKNLGELLIEKNITFAVSDKVEPSVATPITNGMNVRIIKVSEGQRLEVVAIPRQIVYKDDSNIPQGTYLVQNEGRDGAKEVVFKTITENGIEVGKTPLSEKVIYEPVTKIVLKGTKPQIRYTSGLYSEWINDAANKYSIDAAKLQRVMICESGGNPNSVGGGGRFYGLFQYMPSTWSGASAAVGYGGASIFDPKAQIYVTAWKASIQGWGAWPVCGCR